MILSIVTAFCVDTALKSVCSYNNRLEQKKTTLQNSEVSYLGIMTVRYDKVLDCKNITEKVKFLLLDSIPRFVH